ncbi:MAG TPA: flavoprotein, partial [Patescibacteria group bacterium]|nr:flavoprotein [Patescibacteria group bacterium]
MKVETMDPFKNKKIVLGVSGSIAAYKSPLIVRELIKAGASVRVVMTPSAAKFVSPLTLNNLTKYPVAL